MGLELSEIKEAYVKLKSYIYYDTTDIILRRQLVEFESNRTQNLNTFFGTTNEPYSFKGEPFNLALTEVIDKKLEELTIQINCYADESIFFNYLFKQIDVNLYPKKLASDITPQNFISNKRTKNNYNLERVTAFIEAPIELHIVSVLWIMKFGHKLDANLGDYSFGNRLLLDKDKEGVVQGSGLFKPYFRQYQKWRDDSVDTARNLLKDDKSVIFLNLDIKDFFHSVRIDTNDLLNIHDEEENQQSSINLNQIFLKIHTIYSVLVSSEVKIPADFYKDLEPDSKGNIKKVILPIGLLSSYVLANNYLKKFDKRITEKIKPAYYGRYVDDILIVLSDPNPFSNQDETENDLKYDYNDYFSKLNSDYEKASFTESNLNDLEKYVIENFSPYIKLVNSPYSNNYKEDHGRVFKLTGYHSLYCQSEKTLLYYFEKGESDLVIDKLKKELDEKTSEFRDFPDDISGNSFEKNAYHLNYDGSDGKIRTLKDYVENRYGLTLYLSNKIFSALRQETEIDSDEKNHVLKFFQGTNCLNFYRLWEKILTYFLVNDEPNSYIEFYIHCVKQIDNINDLCSNGNDYSLVKETLVKHLDSSHELTISLNPKFIEKTDVSKRNFEFKLNKISTNSLTFFNKSIEPTKPDSFWFSRYRDTNMIRHQYIIHPLLSYTKKSRYGSSDLTNPRISFSEYELDDELISNSPRHIKFWECCLARVFTEFSGFKKFNNPCNEEYITTNILGIEEVKGTRTHYQYGPIKDKTSFYLENAFTLYEKGNANHIPDYYFAEKKFKDQFFKRNYESVHYDKIKPVGIHEVIVNSRNNKLNEPLIAFANTIVQESNITDNLKKETNLSSERYSKLMNILKKSRQDQSDILLFPECFIPINLLSSLVRYSAKNDILVITGLEHVILDNTAFNYVVTILPFEVNGIKDATVLFRLKNHYAPHEEHILTGYHYNIPKPEIYRHDIINWKNIYLSTYYCFELANAFHRSLFKGKIDLMIGIEWNKDTPYFSNIVETCTRDLHIYFAQVNTSNFGDTRLTQPVETERKDILRLKGGLNDTVLIGKINLYKLRDFQRKKFSLTHHDKEYKPLPPDYLLDDVLKRITNSQIITEQQDSRYDSTNF